MRDWLEALGAWRFALVLDSGQGVYVPGPKAVERAEETLMRALLPEGDADA